MNNHVVKVQVVFSGDMDLLNRGRVLRFTCLSRICWLATQDTADFDISGPRVLDADGNVISTTTNNVSQHDFTFY